MFSIAREEGFGQKAVGRNVLSKELKDLNEGLGFGLIAEARNVKALGIDLSTKKFSYAIYSFSENKIIQKGSLEFNKKGLSKLVEIIKKENVSWINCEATGVLGYKLKEGLRELGCDIKVFFVHPKRFNKLKETLSDKVKTDSKDAEILAQLDNFNILKSEKEKNFLPRDLYKKYSAILKDKNFIMKSLHTELSFLFPEFLKVFKTISKEALEFLIEFPNPKAILDNKKKVIEKLGVKKGVELIKLCLEESIFKDFDGSYIQYLAKKGLENWEESRRVKKEIEKILDGFYIEILPNLKLKGVSLLTFLVFGPEINEGPKNFASFFGVVPSVIESGNTKKRGKTGLGSKEVKKLMAVIALRIIAEGKKKPNKYSLFYERLRKRGKPHKVALIAMIRKVLMDISEQYFKVKKEVEEKFGEK
jgi:transposase